MTSYGGSHNGMTTMHQSWLLEKVSRWPAPALKLDAWHPLSGRAGGSQEVSRWWRERSDREPPDNATQNHPTDRRLRSGRSARTPRQLPRTLSQKVLLPLLAAAERPPVPESPPNLPTNTRRTFVTGTGHPLSGRAGGSQEVSRWWRERSDREPPDNATQNHPTDRRLRSGRSARTPRQLPRTLSQKVLLPLLAAAERPPVPESPPNLPTNKSENRKVLILNAFLCGLLISAVLHQSFLGGIATRPTPHA